ncbi:MAG: hypothetical protein K5917_02190 [Clostridiales bacterium]|nr:hypothetical protein [Clostridiales bacterium]
MEFKEIKFFVFVPACIAAICADIVCLVAMLVDVSGYISVRNGIFILLGIFAGVFLLMFILLPHIFPDPSVYLESDKILRDNVKLFKEKNSDHAIPYSEIADVDYSHAKKHSKNGIFIFKYNEVEIKIERVDKKPVYLHVENPELFIEEVIKRITNPVNQSQSFDEDEDTYGAGVTD